MVLLSYQNRVNGSQTLIGWSTRNVLSESFSDLDCDSNSFLDRDCYGSFILALHFMLQFLRILLAKLELLTVPAHLDSLRFLAVYNYNFRCSVMSTTGCLSIVFVFVIVLSVLSVFSVYNHIQCIHRNRTRDVTTTLIVV